MHKQSNQEDFIVGVPTAGRVDSSLEKLVGMFFNTLPIRAQVVPELSLKVLLEEIHRLSTRALENQQYIYEDLIYQLNLKRNADRSILFDVLFKLQNITEDAVVCDVATPDTEFNLGELTLKTYSFEKHRAKHDLTLEILDRKEYLECYFEYCTKLFKQETILRFAQHLIQIYTAMASDINIAVKDINPLSGCEQKEILEGFNDTCCDYPVGKTIPLLFEEQAEKTPGNVAIKYKGRSITYKELNERANRIAWTLVGKGVGADDVVGILADRSIEMIAGIFGILKAGAAYLPIDPRYPKDRIEYMISNSKAKLLLSENSKATIGYGVPVLLLGSPENYEENTGNLRKTCSDRNLAYIIYTSGTTGRPKGVMIEHRSIINRIYWMQKAYPISQEDIILQKTTYTFDVSVWEILWWSMVGASVFMLPQGEEKDPEAIVRTVEEEHITIMHFVPSMLNMFLKYVVSEGAESRLACLRNVFASGEALQKAQSDLFYERLTKNNHTRLINVYGPTEAAVDVTWFDMEENHASEQVYIGKPIDNIRIYILDPYNHLLPIGVPGELCISGIGLARGYINNKELTDEKFIDNPFEPGEKLYKTGDAARWTEKGFLEYIGRMDSQVKIRGFRIEPGEIETVLLNCSEVKEAAVVVQQLKEEKYICAYYVSDDKKLLTEDLKAAIKKKLPEYMVPSYFIRLEEIPVSGNGKLNRKALPMPDSVNAPSETYVKPENELQQYLVSVWKDVLGVGQVGIKDNFFELGGHSLNILEIQTRIHKEKGVKLALHDMFRLTILEALAELIKKSEKTVFNAIEPVNRRDCYEVSSGQRRLLILHELNPQDISYNLVSAYDIRGILDKERLEKTFQQLFARHEIFRTRFTHEEDYKQVIEEEVKVPVHYVRCREEDIDSTIDSAIRNFDLFQTPLADIHVLELSDERNILVLNVHHIIADGVSVSILVKEFVACYNGQPLEVCGVQYKDYAAWQNRRLEGNYLEGQEAYWLSLYNDDIPVLNLPMDYPREAVRSNAGSDCCFSINRELKDRISELAVKTGTTAFMVLLAGYNILLGKYTNQEDLVVGTPVSGRTHENIRNMVGMFINVLPIRNKPKYNKTFAGFLKEVKESCLQGYENQDYPFERLIEKLNISGGLERNSLVEVLFAMENIGDTTISIDGLQFDEYRVKSTACKYDMCLYAKETQDTIEFMLEYSKALFDALTMKRFCNNFIQLLECIVKYPDYEIGQLNYIDEQEKNILLNQFNNTTSDYPAGKTLQQLFEEQAVKTPDHIAVSYKEDSITYQELNERANRIAWTLIKQGVKPDDIVGIMTDRCIEMIVGIYGILKAGAAYMPIDRLYPEDRIEYMVTNSRANIILAQHTEEAEGYPVKVISLFKDTEWSAATENPVNTGSDTNLAYIIYTSGTTGRPKGVMIEHRSIVNRLHWMQKEYPLSEADVILQKTTYTFDVSVWELLWWSLTGASVRMLPQGDEKDPEAIVKNIEEGQVTVVHFVPSMLSVFLAHVISEACYSKIRSLVYVFASGEALQKVLCDSFYREITLKNKSQLVNLYGPTEAAVDVTCFNCAIHPDASEIYIGKPIDNIKLYILDQNRRLVPIGVVGELCISGIGVARGYINNEKLTDEKFLENPYLPGERIYTTGDLARWKDDGNIEYFGRIDNQVKIRGFRIELGEIEKVLLAVEGIKEAAVIAREENGGKYICAYYVSDRKQTLYELRNTLINKLPEYMVPSYFVAMESIPVNNNGKLNRKALPVPENIGLRDEGYQAPETVTEQIVSKIWQEVLSVERVGRGDNFFRLGGHSLTATLVLTRLRKRLQINVMLKDIFQYSVLKDFAKYIDGLDKSEVYNIMPGGDRTSYPVTSEQLGIYLASAKGSTNYNISFISKITGAMDIEKVYAVLNTIVRRHKALRTCFVFEDGALVQKVTDIMLDIPMVEVKSEKEKKNILEHLVQPFDLSTGPLLRCLIVKEAEEKYILGFDMHHIIFDGYSISNFIREFTQLYQNKLVSELLVSYGDYALWQKDFTGSEVFKKQEAYWMGKFAVQVPKLRLPVDYESDGNPCAGDRVYLDLPSAELLKLAQETGTTLFMVLLSAYFILLQKYTGQEDIVVGVPVMGRRNNDLQVLLGMFVKSIPIRCCPEMSKEYHVFLEEVKESVFEAFENQDYTFGELPGRIGLNREEQAGLFSTMFILQNIEYPSMELEGLRIENCPVYNQGSKYPIELFVNQNEKDLMLELNYAAQLFNEDSMRDMLKDYEKIIRCILTDSHIRIADINVVDEEELTALREDISAVTDEMSMDFMF
ncbi:MAG: amino acid adenylation domain-containing protein [Ruminiclostridium sp.]